MPDEPREPADLADRYARLREQARLVNHAIHVTVIPGAPLERREPRTVIPMNGPEPDLATTLDLVEAYLGTDEARERGALYARRDEAQAVQAAAFQDWRRAVRVLRDLEAEVDADTAAEVDADDEDDEAETLPPGVGVEFRPADTDERNPE